MQTKTRWLLAGLATLALAASAVAQEPAPATAAPAAPIRGGGRGDGLGVRPVGRALRPSRRGGLPPADVQADRGRFHFETRYNYEDRESTSFFVGANFEFGDELKLTLTPMIGGLVGQTDAIVPGLEADLSIGLFEAYGEAEYVFDLDDSSSKYFYMWSELSGGRPSGCERAS